MCLYVLMVCVFECANGVCVFVCWQRAALTSRFASKLAAATTPAEWKFCTRVPGAPSATPTLMTAPLPSSADSWATTRESRSEKRGGKQERERENSNSNSKTLFYKDCSLGSFKNLPNN